MLVLGPVLQDQPFSVTVRGLQPRTRAVLGATSTDAAGVRWSSQTTFVADSKGRLDPSRVAPVNGYSEIDAMGFIAHMRPSNPDATFYSWGLDGQREFDLTVSTARARASVRRDPALCCCSGSDLHANQPLQ